MRRLLRFSLGSLILLTVLVAGGLALWRAIYQPLVEQRQAVRTVVASEAKVESTPWPPSWRSAVIEEAALVDTTSVDFSPEAAAIVVEDLLFFPEDRGRLRLTERKAIPKASLVALVDLAGLQRLNLAETDVDDEVAPILARLTDLRELDLRGTRIGDATVAKLAGLEHLETLHLAGTEATPASIDVLLALPALKTLSINQPMYQGRARLAAHPTLERLMMTGWGASDPAWVDSPIRRFDRLYKSSGRWSHQTMVPVLPTDRETRRALLRARSDDPAAKRGPSETWRILAKAEGLTELYDPPSLPAEIPEDALPGLAELEVIRLHVHPYGPHDEQRRFNETIEAQMAAIARLPNLRRIAIEGAYAHSPKVYAPLATLKKLEQLQLRSGQSSGTSNGGTEEYAAAITSVLGGVETKMHRVMDVGRLLSDRLPETLADCPPQIFSQADDLEPIGPLTEDTAKALLGHKPLRRLILATGDISEEALRLLGAHENLNTLTLNGPVSPELADALVAMPNLMFLNVFDENLSDEAILTLLGEQGPEHVALVSPRLLPDTAAELLTRRGYPGPWTMRPRVHQLEAAGWRGSRMGEAAEISTDAGPRHVAFAPIGDGLNLMTVDPNQPVARLKALSATFAHPPTDQSDRLAAEMVKRADNLVSLQANLAAIPPDLSAALPGRQHLRSVGIAVYYNERPDFGWGDFFAAIPRVAGLEHLRIDDNNLHYLTAPEIDAAGRCGRLNVFWTRIQCSYQVLDTFARLGELRTLVLFNCQAIDQKSLDAWYAPRKGTPDAPPPRKPLSDTAVFDPRLLTAWPNLRHLVLPALKLTPAAVEAIARHGGLEIVWIDVSQLTPDQVVPLLDLPRLKHLGLAHCGWSEAVKADLVRRAGPAITVHFRNDEHDWSASGRSDKELVTILHKHWENTTAVPEDGTP